MTQSQYYAWQQPWGSYELMTLYERFTGLMDQADPSTNQWIMHQLRGFGPDHVLHGLDLGCGVGRWTRRLRDVCATVTGVDSSPMMLSRASVGTNSPYITYRESSILDVTETADVVLCVYAAHHAGPANAVRSHIRSLVRPGGVAVIVDVINTGGWASRRYHLERAERLRDVVAETLDDASGGTVYELLTHPAWLGMVGEHVPLTMQEFTDAAQYTLPGSVVTALGPETAGVVWRHDDVATDVTDALRGREQLFL